jgi:hypothetical protein
MHSTPPQHENIKKKKEKRKKKNDKLDGKRPRYPLNNNTANVWSLPIRTI